MENTNEPQDQNKEKNAVGGNGRSALASAVLRATGKQPAEESHAQPEISGEPSPEDAAASLLGISDDSAGIEGGAGEGESYEPVEDVWQFGGNDYTAVQVEEALNERENYQRFNQSVKPLMETVTNYGNQFEQASLLATTECDNQIAELTKAMNSNQLTPAQYQQAGMQLRDAKARKTLLEQAAKEETQLRASALGKIREHNARQSVTALIRKGWTQEQVMSAAKIAQRVVGEKFGDIISPDLLQVFRDAAELRGIKDSTAKRLREKQKTVLKTTKQATTRPAPVNKAQPQSFGQKVWGDKYR